MAKCADEVDFNHDDDDDVRTSTMGVTKQKQGRWWGVDGVFRVQVCVRERFYFNLRAVCAVSAPRGV